MIEAVFFALLWFSNLSEGDSMEIKEGVIMAGLQIEMRQPLVKANKIWRDHNQELVVTSALDGVHSEGSLHYYGYALDFRTRYFSATTRRIVAAELRDALGSDYQVIEHNTHIHVEYQKILEQLALETHLFAP